MDIFELTGGARLDGINVSYPLAKLSVTTEAIHLSCMGRDYHFPRSSIRGLRRHQGLLSVGLRIEHSEQSLPKHVVFWASMFFWNRGFQELKTQLRKHGYNIT
jgi:hypothetical protein